ncbi:hypothetical protein ColLi_03106 [Colletotrichum liriopes]|uniref:Uncharacterized protein n=1 Tax=Colletotrichum liriopes TaxID=708192 RepID=A0AA37GG20_9PEZI|nr:hypothetical protein ColLi_03106 [Colletotrichum liriopes]
MSEVHQEKNGMALAMLPKPEPLAGNGSDGHRPDTEIPTPAQPSAARSQDISFIYTPPHNSFAVWYLINLSSLTVGSLAAQSPAINYGFKAMLMALAIFPFFISFINIIIVAYDMWPRSGHAKVLGGILGFSLALAYVVVTPGWTDDFEGDSGRISWALGGFHLGFVLEGVTGCVGRMLKVLEGTSEEPEPPRNRFAQGTGSKPEPPAAAPSL